MACNLFLFAFSLTHTYTIRIIWTIQQTILRIYKYPFAEFAYCCEPPRFKSATIISFSASLSFSLQFHLFVVFTYSLSLILIADLSTWFELSAFCLLISLSSIIIFPSTYSFRSFLFFPFFPSISRKLSSWSHDSRDVISYVYSFDILYVCIHFGLYPLAKIAFSSRLQTQFRCVRLLCGKKGRKNSFASENM